MSSNEKHNEIASLAQDLINMLERFDETAMSKALAHSHQIVDNYKRESTLAGKTDSVSWEYEIVQNDAAQMEHLLKARAYDTIEQRASFAKIYSGIVKRDIMKGKGE
ncbi:hypothetical protein [Cohnella thailandensis]|uniref:Uncharacterized protein n=1 Tax=Cohnella thailandensis TaxID=557557 RepID=A0A841SRQ0_9BACL|nr:hypothetical protein [Cohnella thailandensis]MBB6632745.1 hypothetical protein [Cohnella thailandensis]MBP1975566.1 hypothetical protein [Cohnella thailandensis]